MMNAIGRGELKQERTIVYPDPQAGEAPLAHNRDVTYDAWRTKGSVMWAEGILGTGGWLAVSYDTCQTLLAAHPDLSREIFVNHRRVPSIKKISPDLKWFENNLYFRDEPAHTRMKSLFESALEDEVLVGINENINSCLGNILPELRRHGEFDLVYDIAWPLACAANEYLGVPPKDAWRFPAWEAERIGSRFLMPLPEMSLDTTNAKSMTDQLSYMRRLVLERRSSQKDDLISTLLRRKNAGHDVSDEELVSNILFFSMAAFNGLRDQLSGAILSLLQSTEGLISLSTDLSLMPVAIEELLRLTAPDQLLFQVATRDFEIGEALVEEGDLVIAVLGAANRDPTVFQEPHQFSLYRPNSSQHLAGGASSYACLGIKVTKAVMSATLAGLIELLPNWKIQSISWSDALQDRAPRRVMLENRPNLIK